MRWIIRSAVCGLLCAGCSTPSHRIHRDPDRFAAFPPDAQALIREGRIDLGFTPDMVEMALGKPTRVLNRRDEQGTEIIWSYLTFRSDGASFDTWSLYPSRVRRYHGLAPFVEWEEGTETVRVQFRDGVVSVVESLDRRLTPP
jgi:hypothetical protein